MAITRGYLVGIRRRDRLAEGRGRHQEAPEWREWQTERAALVGYKSGVMPGLKREMVELA
jgi:hypothetical protein